MACGAEVVPKVFVQSLQISVVLLFCFYIFQNHERHRNPYDPKPEVNIKFVFTRQFLVDPTYKVSPRQDISPFCLAVS